MIAKLKYGNTNTYYLNGLLLDTDMPGTMPGFYREIKKNGIPFSEIRFVVATHYHPDHMGLIGELMTHGVKLAVFENQIGSVHSFDAILTRKGMPVFIPVDEKKAMVLSFSESREFLSRFGLSGEILQTESHSPDGIAVALDDGICFVGDLEPYSFIGAYDGNSALENDWKNIMNHHPKVIYSGHVNDVIL